MVKRCHATGRAASPSAVWDQGPRMPQNMEIKSVGWSGGSANEGLNLGAGMQQRFVGNRRRRSGEERGIHGACWCWWKQFRKLGRTNCLAFCCSTRMGSSLAPMLVKTSFAVPCWTPAMFNTFGLQVQQLARIVLYLFQRKQHSPVWVFWEVWRGRPTCISCLGHCHCQFCRDFQQDVVLNKWIKWEKVSRSQSATWFLAPEQPHTKILMVLPRGSAFRHTDWFFFFLLLFSFYYTLRM